MARQEFASVPRPDLCIVIADNEGSEDVRLICERFQIESGIPLTYVHEPRRGISFVRNACLDRLPQDCDFLAFIDDDEVPKEDWLDQLLLTQRKTGADVVQGRVVPDFEGEPPRWIADGEFFAVPRRGHKVKLPQVEDLTSLDRAATNNVLIRTQPIHEHQLRFAVPFALSGGSDTVFFRTMHGLGYLIVYAADAVVVEHVPAKRATLGYLLRVRFRIGNTAARVDAEEDRRATLQSVTSRMLSACGDIISGLRRLLKSLITGRWEADRLAIGVMRIAYGVGYMAGTLGYRYQHYK